MSTMHKICLSILLLFSLQQFSLASNKKAKKKVQPKANLVDDLTFGVGMVSVQSGLYQIDNNANANKIDPKIFIVSSIKTKLINSLSFNPELGIYFPESTRDKNISKITYYFLMPLQYQYRGFITRLGVGQSFTRINANGGTQPLPNGDGTENFHMPEISSTSMNTVLNLGLGYKFNKQFSSRLESFLFNIHEKETRIFHHTLSLHYHFGAINKI